MHVYCALAKARPTMSCICLVFTNQVYCRSPVFLILSQIDKRLYIEQVKQFLLEHCSQRQNMLSSRGFRFPEPQQSVEHLLGVNVVSTQCNKVRNYVT